MARDDRLVQGIEELYRTRYRQFLRVATVILGDGATAHDAVQEGFAQALKQRLFFRGDGPLEGWVWRVVTNAALAARRSQRADQESSESSEDWPSRNGQAADESGVRVWIAGLPERQRLAVYLRYYADLDYRATVSATLSAAHQTLRRCLEEVSR